MINRAFQYDLVSKNWIECKDENFINADVEGLPTSLINKLLNVTDVAEKEIYIAVRWRIFQKSSSDPVNISGDVAYVRIYENGNSRPSWHNFSICTHIPTRRLVISKVSNRGFWLDATEIEIPEIVVESAIEAMRESTKFAHGIKPSILNKEACGNKKIIAYIERPFDLNIVYLKHFFNQIDFDKTFTYDCKDNYRVICELLKINPPKSLRKAYAITPYSIIIYMILLQCGIDDVNFIQKFLYLKERIINFHFQDLYFDFEENRVATEYSYPHYWDSDLVNLMHYCKFVIRHRDEKKLSNWLYRMSTQDEIEKWQFDIFSMLKQYEDRVLSDDVKNLLIHEGPTKFVHDLMAAEIREHFYSYGVKEFEIDYEQKILDYECNIDGYSFVIAKNNKDLVNIAMELKNCVAGYCNAVSKGHSIIVSVTYDDKYVACIEIVSNNRVTQALGKYNQKLTGELYEVFSKWAEEKNLITDAIK